MDGCVGLCVGRANGFRLVLVFALPWKKEKRRVCVVVWL